MRGYKRASGGAFLAQVKMEPPRKVNMRTVIHHKRRKVLGNERMLGGVVLYKGTITRKGVRALELIDIEM